jgi:hypothetical protein
MLLMVGRCGWEISLGMIGDVDGFKWTCTLLVIVCNLLMIVNFVGSVGFVVGIPSSDGRVLIMTGEWDCSVFEKVIDRVGGLRQGGGLHKSRWGLIVEGWLEFGVF